MNKYILDEAGNPHPEEDLLKWALWFEKSDSRRVDHTRIGDSTVSTVFLGLDHGWEDGEVILWETMVFGGPLDQHRWNAAPETGTMPKECTAPWLKGLKHNE